MLVSHYKIKCSAFIPQNYDYFLNIIPWHTGLFIPSWQEFKFVTVEIRLFLHLQPFMPFVLPHCCEIGGLSCIASGFQSYLSCIHMQMFIIPKGADLSCKMFLCLEFDYQEVHTGNDTLTAVRMAKHVHISHFHKYVFTDHV